MPSRDKTPEVNVFQHTDKFFPPTLIIMGETDGWKPATDGLVEKLQANSDNEVFYWVAPNESHMFFRRKNWFDTTKRLIDDFLVQQGYLEGESFIEPQANADKIRLVEMK